MRTRVSDFSFKAAVVAAAIALMGIIAIARFHSVPALPPRPMQPAATQGSAQDLLEKTLRSPAVWRNFLATDAGAANVPVPTVAEMSKRFAYRSDDTRHVLSFKNAKLLYKEVGLELVLERGTHETALLAITNTAASDVAYRIVATPNLGTSVCNAADPVPTNALVIGKGDTERRTVCVFRADLELTVSKVESIELSPLSSWYVQQVNPLAIGLAPRLARSHRSEVSSKCSPIVPQSVRSGLESGKLTWRDLIDFYARHRCETFQFPNYYRAFKEDSEIPLPALVAAPH
jgi:hypothetical protein